MQFEIGPTRPSDLTEHQRPRMTEAEAVRLFEARRRHREAVQAYYAGWHTRMRQAWLVAREQGSIGARP